MMCVKPSAQGNIFSQDDNDVPAPFSAKDPLWCYLGLNTTESLAVPRCVFIWYFSQLWDSREGAHGERGGKSHITLALYVRGRCKPPQQMAFFFFANSMAASQELSVLPLNWAEQARQRERLYPFHLPPPWHLVHLSCGPVVVTGEWLRFVPDQKILGKQVGPFKSPLIPRRPEMPGSSGISPGITCHLSLQNWTEDPEGFCQHRDRFSMAKAPGPALFFHQPWIALRLKPPVSFHLKSSKYLEENNPIWKSVGVYRS